MVYLDKIKNYFKENQDVEKVFQMIMVFVYSFNSNSFRYVLLLSVTAIS